MPMVKVACTVSNCDYWMAKNYCNAEEILIATDLQADRWGDRIDAPMHAQLEPGHADTCMATCCKTFRPKGDKGGPNLHHVSGQKAYT